MAQLSELLLSKNEIQDKKKIKIRDHIRGILGGKCHVICIKYGATSALAYVVHLMNVNRTSYRFGLEKSPRNTESIRSIYSKAPYYRGKSRNSERLATPGSVPPNTEIVVGCIYAKRPYTDFSCQSGPNDCFFQPRSLTTVK